MEKDYNNLDKVIVTCQAEMDDIPDDYKGRIYIKATERITVSKRYFYRVVARENSSVVAWENSSVVARENSSVEARENSSVEAWENSSVEARENSSVEAWGNVQVLDRSCLATIQACGNARIVHNPQTVLEYLDFYNVNQTEDKAILYKAVRKIDDKYVSDYKNSFTYEIGKSYEEDCDKNRKKECSYGLHVSHLDWALRFGANWKDLAILEVEVPIDTIVLPDNSGGKVRTSCLKVLREVPLEECGLYGKMLAKRRVSNGNHKRN